MGPESRTITSYSTYRELNHHRRIKLYIEMASTTMINVFRETSNFFFLRILVLAEACKAARLALNRVRRHFSEYQGDYLNPSASLAVFSLQCSFIHPLFSSDPTLCDPHLPNVSPVDRPFPALLISAAGALLELLQCASTPRPVQNDSVDKKCTALLLAEMELEVSSQDGLTLGVGDSISVRDP